jgi:hypothetical protein
VLIKRIVWKVQANAERLAHPIAMDRHSHFTATGEKTCDLETASTIISPQPDTQVPLSGANIVKTYKGRSIQVRVRRD